MKLTILGPQGSGKGTQAKLLADKLGIPHISTGDIFRENMRQKTELGRLAAQYINDGNLVPDEITISMVKNRLAEQDCSNGFILDGFPRNIAQAKALDEEIQLDFALEVHISDEEAVRRISGRRTCEQCSRVYNIYIDDIAEKCLKCGGRLIIREDDKEEAIRKRLKIYHKETKPLIDFYKKKGILLSFDGERPIDVINKDIIEKLNPKAL